jgi:hypothetical protein
VKPVVPSHSVLLGAVLLLAVGASVALSAELNNEFGNASNLSGSPDSGDVSTAVAAENAFYRIAGSLPSVVKAQDKPYLVVGDIIVEPGKTVTFEEGTKFLFRNFTGLQVHGTLMAKGTKDKPIVFTSEHDKKYGSVTAQDPAPFDWNGITVTENAVGSFMANCRIGYSMFGINALTEYITLKNIIFRQNGRADITIKGTKQQVYAGEPFDYQPLGTTPVPGVASSKSSISAGKIVMRTITCVAFAAGCAAGTWKTLDFQKSDRQFRLINNGNNITNLRNPDIINVWKNAESKRSNDLLGLEIGYGAALIGAIAFTITFF